MTRRFGIGNIIWSPLEGGWLSGKYRGRATNPKDTPRATQWVGDLANPKFDRRKEAIEKLAGVSEARDVEMAELATAWTLHNPDVTAAIIGPRTMAQLESSLRALDVRLAPEESARIDAIVPPGASVL